jgi:predicted enzyme related to lactoylglutathione lyase
VRPSCPRSPAASCWNFYFWVDSIGAAVERVKSGGGQDPQGAMFSLIGSRE